MGDLQPYVAKVGDWVNYYGKTDKKPQSAGVGGSVVAPSGEASSRVESKPLQTTPSYTSASVPPVISPTQEAVNQSILSMKRTRRTYKKRGNSKKRTHSQKRPNRKKKQPSGKKRKKRNKTTKKKSTNTKKKTKKKKRKKKPKKKSKASIKISAKRSKKKQALQRKKRKRTSVKKKVCERDLYPTII